MNETNRIRPVGLSVITGINGSGKTAFMGRMAQQDVVGTKYLPADALRQPLNAHIRSWIKQAIQLEQGLIFEWLEKTLRTHRWTAGESLIEWLESIQTAKCSAGQLRLLWMILAASVGTKDGSTILVDEVEQSLHPTWLRDLVRELEDIAHIRQLKIIVTTHSPTLIDDAGEWVSCLDPQG